MFTLELLAVLIFGQDLSVIDVCIGLTRVYYFHLIYVFRFTISLKTTFRIVRAKTVKSKYFLEQLVLDPTYCP